MKVSILTINLNNRNGLDKTMQSVFNQTFTDYEYIVIDGGSNDGSKELIEENSNKIDYWISERDNGLYHAMNKAIKMSNGEYCFFLNSGDYFVNTNVLTDVFKHPTDADIISGNVLKVRENGRWNRVKSHEVVSLHKLMIASLPHQASFIKRYLFEEVGYYNEKYKIVSDWEFFLKALILNNYTYQHFEIDISYFFLDGISSQKSSIPLAKLESMECIETHFEKLKDDLIDYRYFYNSNIGNMYLQLKKHPKLYNAVERICEILFVTKKYLFRK